MPQLVRLYIRQVIIGFAVSAAFVTVLLIGNVANLGHLVLNSDIGWIAVLMLWIFNGIVFAGVQFALSLPSDHGDDDDTRGRRDALPSFAPQPALVRIRHTEPTSRSRH